jgi:hypothetical protein
VQIAWDKGWNATAGGRRVRTWSDTLGQMVVAPQRSGPWARAIHRAALAGGGLWILVAILWRKRSGLTKTN